MSNLLQLVRMSTSSNFEPLNEIPDSATSESNNKCENPQISTRGGARYGPGVHTSSQSLRQRIILFIHV